ncbi:MAG: hypothetical protein K0S47_2777 [Herbinix sp.]|jgi:Mor family transcriptional regulator|nr:hypothetical protein [Herbinix sp.]
MKYENAQNIIPTDILNQLQQYVDGIYLYIPKKEKNKKPWGQMSGFRQELMKRNHEIYTNHKNGVSVKEIAMSYYLTENSIRRIIRKCKESIS